MKNILEIKDLHVSFDTYAGEVKAVRGINLEVAEGEVLAIVGESGCGKSVTSQTIMKLNPSPPCRIVQGEINLCNDNIVPKTEKEMINIRGKQVSMIFQDPMTCLNPTMQVGKQLTEAIRCHQKLTDKQALQEAIRLLKLVNIPNPEERANQYPHQFSGGMRQRVMIAMALSCKPKLLIADEPTTALDVTIQAQIMELLKEIKEKTNTAIILITHDLGVVASIADRVAVMYAGKIVETGQVREIFYNSKHPYTKALLKSLPTIDTVKGERLLAIPGTPPDLLMPPKGCGFASRCRECMKVCQQELPSNYTITNTHEVSCWLMDPMCPSHTLKEEEA